MLFWSLFLKQKEVLRRADKQNLSPSLKTRLSWEKWRSNSRRLGLFAGFFFYVGLSLVLQTIVLVQLRIE